MKNIEGVFGSRLGGKVAYIYELCASGESAVERVAETVKTQMLDTSLNIIS